MKINSKSDFLKSIPRGTKVHPVEIGSDTYFVLELSVPARTKFDMSLDKKKHPRAMESLREKLIIATVCDEEGKLLFSPGDEPEMRDMLCGAFEQIFTKAADVNGISQKDLEDARKNCETIPTGS